MIGRRLGHFEITARLGEGGMGVVWRAIDAQLGRQVAIKVLPEAFTEDPERLARFEREAKLLAQLNHPNIAQIYGLEASGETRALVMELVEGPTLGERLALGAVPVDEALAIARQIAEALEEAHEKGIIHRDLKPQNIKLTPEGKVKVLDFGLAKALDPATGASGAMLDRSHSPTMTLGATVQGVILGTAAYMAPEQAKGQAADRRADIWAFGVVLYETLTGGRLFTGDSVPDTLAGVLRSGIDLERLPVDTPPSVRRLLRRCLERNPKNRLHDIADARIVLQEVLAGGVEHTPTAAAPAIPAPRPVWRQVLPWALAAGSALAFAWLALRPPSPSREMPLRKLEITELDEVGLFGFGIAAAISPDGSAVAYLSEGKLWLRRLSELEPRQVPGSQFESMPVWSPDSRWLVYPAGRKLWRVSVEGGEPRAIADLPTNVGPFGGGWSEEGRIILTTGYSGLLEVSAQGGNLREVLAPDPETEADFHQASLLPGGRGVLFSIHYKDRPEAPIAVWDGRSRKVLLEEEGLGLEQPVYSDSGHLLFYRRPTNAGLWAVPFSLEGLEVTGEPFLVAPDADSPSLAADGSLVFVRGVEAAMRELVWVDRSGREIEVAGVAQPGILQLALSPQGGRVALSAAEGNSRDLWLQDLERGTKSRLTFGADAVNGMTFSPDGQRLAYYVAANEPQIYLLDVEARSPPLRVGPGGRPHWSPTGELVYELFGARGIWYVDFAEDGTPGEPRLILDPPADESEPEVSPDGRLLAYSADESGRFEVYLTRFPSGEGKWQVSSQGGALPRWGPAGDEIFYVDAEGDVMSAPVSGGPSPRVGAPVRLFSGLPYGLGGDRELAVGEEGARFLVSRRVGEVREKPKLVLVQNWFAEFRGGPSRPGGSGTRAP
ncbi:MAG TPA: protein kinase [Thermoanaerobaculia bacterium]|nr:protein kinase [Thermoanaerobaculia bacterium]